VARIEGVIDPVTFSYFERVLHKAENESEFLILELDTPGGLDESMREIVKAELNSPIPVVVYIHPSGARAASAGVFITLASHVAVMTPGTNIGAAHPVAIGGEGMDEVMKEKATNDAAAYIRSLAKKRGRNEKWAEEAVRKSSSITAEEAEKKDVIDFTARDLNELLRKLDGVKVEVRRKEITLKTEGLEVERVPMNWRERFLHALSNPTLTYLLLVLGFYGIIYELANPGFGFSGIGGAVCLILAFYSFHILPINYAGLALIAFSLILFVAEAMTPTFGVLTLGGLISFILGSLILFESPLPALRVSLWTIVPVALLTFFVVFLAARAIIKTHRRKGLTGKEGMVGLVGEAESDLNPSGQVFVRGELWKAESVEGVIKKGEEIEVVEVEGLKLKVKKKGG
jgi:membrane-bound serine protease (ClpP class)